MVAREQEASLSTAYATEAHETSRYALNCRTPLTPGSGKLTANEHNCELFFKLREQKKRGYYANFVCDFDEPQ